MTKRPDEFNEYDVHHKTITKLGFLDSIYILFGREITINSIITMEGPFQKVRRSNCLGNVRPFFRNPFKKRPVSQVDMGEANLNFVARGNTHPIEIRDE